ncbi:MAG: hypothetical protein DWI58_20860 [Chloroflexi bacterium]|nr:MAG: hypothetical protein DWI58_20860 [Chloroflexota bacterium]
MESTFPEFLTVMEVPGTLREQIRASNGLERIHQELQRPFTVTHLFINDESCLRLASAILMKICDAWQLGKMVQILRDERTDHPSVE